MLYDRAKELGQVIYPTMIEADTEQENEEHRMRLLQTCLEQVKPIDLSNLNKESLIYIFETKALPLET